MSFVGDSSVLNGNLCLDIPNSPSPRRVFEYSDYKSSSLCSDNELNLGILTCTQVLSEYKDEVSKRRHDSEVKKVDEELRVYVRKKHKCFAFQLSQGFFNHELFVSVRDYLTDLFTSAGCVPYKAYSVNNYIVIKVKKPIIFDVIILDYDNYSLSQVQYDKVYKYISE